MPPREVWAMTLIEYDLALRGFNEAHGGGAPQRGMSRVRLAELMALYPDKAA